MRHFVGINSGCEPVPDETTVCRFRHLLERHGLGAKIFARVNGYLESRRVKIGTGAIVDATLLEAPSSTKNKPGKRKVLPELLHGEEVYQGQSAVLAERAPKAEDPACRRWPSKLHVWLEARDRGLKKNPHRLLVCFALVNLITAKKTPARLRAAVCPRNA